ncbi:DUF1349 domain-containing protein [Vibrio sp. 1CM2L]|uniref:beta-xylosidase family glycoside hydrolase n=1 Tax=Vibrio sp. 1CM2L TaxID=2929166 RepID=UPI0020BEB9C6|nr:DUF1349 domain-containing protein [Vibrio sp. 1CM2L]MCK8077279.1 DUF1349 domain-containing protein [Vibrio sp. 1CM2L]
MNNLVNWQIRNENPEHWSLENGVLTLQVQEGNIFGAGSADVDNIFVHPVSSADYSTEVTVQLDPNRAFEQAGLGIYWDNDNYIKVSKEMFMGERSLVFVVEQNGQPQIKERLLFSESSVSVKLVKQGGKVSAHFRPLEKQQWQEVITFDSLVGSDQGVMLYTFSGSKATPNFAKFSGFSLSDV